MPSKVKVDLVGVLTEEFGRARSVVVADYIGLTVAQMTDLRRRLRAEGGNLRVVKNRLAKLALKGSGNPSADQFLVGPSVFALSFDDPIAGAKILSQFEKENEKLQVKCAVLDGAVLDKAGVQTLASLPSREAMLGRLLGDLKSPTQKLAFALQGTVNKIGYALRALIEAREKAA